MRKMNKFTKLILIFAIILFVSLFVINSNVYASGDGIFQNAFTKGSKFSQTAKNGGTENILNEAGNVIGAITGVKVAIYFFGFVLIMYSGLKMFMGLSMDTTGEKKAQTKIMLAIFFSGVALFILAEPVLNLLISFFEDLEGLM